MRPLLIDEAARENCRRVLDYAESHPYHIPQDGPIPGDNPEHVVHLQQGFRCVFSYTHEKGRIYRHLSISVNGGKYPNPFAAFTVAELFGFTGWNGRSIEVPPNWMAGMNEVDHCIVLMQETAL